MRTEERASLYVQYENWKDGEWKELLGDISFEETYVVRKK